MFQEQAVAVGLISALFSLVNLVVVSIWRDAEISFFFLSVNIKC